MDHNQDSFQYTYSAAQQAEVEKIRSKYVPREIDKMEQLRQLDRSATQKAQVWALTLGILGALLLGTGMSLFMTDLGASLGALAFVLGIVIGVVGLVALALAYPLYNHILRKERTRIALQILLLTDELMK